MPTYRYTAKSLKGEEKAGLMEAKDEHQLAGTLRSQGFILIRAETLGKEKGKRKLDISIPFLSGVSLEEKLMFVRNLQVMITSGLSLPKALQTLSAQTKSNAFKKALLEIAEEIVRGESFSDSLKKYPKIFSELFQNMIKVGEESGTLDEVLTVLTRQMEREHELKSKVRGALMYPAVIISAMIGIGILMLIIVVPKLADTFKELEIELPLTTKLVIGIGTFLAEKWLLALLIIVAFVFLSRLILAKREIKRIIDALTLRIPVISPLIKKTNSAYTARTLSSLIASGVPIVRSLEITSGALSNVYFKRSLSEASEKVRKGAKLSEALEPYHNIYPLIIFQMIKVGEETGETSEILSKLAEFFEEEVSNATKNLASVIEPILMLFIGAAVGFFAISMVQPMYSMLGAL
jgi:type IV pilus assembly protein PilC